ncbi:helicase SNF [Cohnella sp. CFH 77786]|uniref:DEAD/DEAH box helicase n=1 Tax=Cohnella sp. CFH 77786 TaxID=2662265 RepID=UPI001C609C45|nr:DEAD/DEAH box helicase [Cohnella sp. CFH 77786]MBW5448039.1 helicase SNF [Cohnella sp. CFH 77786]
MRLQFSLKTIRSLCGQVSYAKGETLCRAGKVEITRYDAAAGICEAIVKGRNGNLLVSIAADPQEEIDARCSCPTLGSYDRCCQHIAAVLLSLRDIPADGAATVQASAPPGDFSLTESVLGLFASPPKSPASTRIVQDARPLLDVEFTCRPVPYGYRKLMLGIEMKAGPKRLYVVQKIREFLDRVDRREPYAFSGHFAYEPSLHGFRPEDGAVLRQLTRVLRHEKMYRDASNPFATDTQRISGDRMLLVPPVFWDNLLPLLAAAPSARMEQDDYVSEGIRIVSEPLPLRFRLQFSASGTYELAIDGLDRIAVMESYGMVLHEARIVKVRDDLSHRLAEFKRMLETSGKTRLPVSPAQIGDFMEKVVPVLMKLGSVRIDEAVADRVTRIPLKAKLYLDRVKDRLLAGLEFHYGEIVINPLETETRRGGDRILMRDGERETRILELMEQIPFAKTESGYFLAEEEAEYDFLYHVVPQLQKLADIYATSAVKTRLFAGHAPPRIIVDSDERTDWLYCRFELEGFPPNEIRRLVQAVEEKRRFYKMPSGALMPLEGAELQDIIRFFREVGIRSENVTGAEIKVPLARALHLMDADERRAGIRLGKSFRRLLEDMRNPDSLDFPVPDSLAPVLRDYQRVGYQWLKTLTHYRFGGILADDMGLGKTVQSIAFLVSVLPEIRAEGLPALIVAPSSLLYNWRNELEKFAPDVRAVVADGGKTERNRLLRSERADVVITSYPLLLKDLERFAGMAFHTVILDEAQAFKNPTTQTAQAVKQIGARHRFALTGTPIENRLEELWSLYDVVCPGLFPDRKEFGEMSREAVARRIRPFLLRRLKTDVLTELPEKIESVQASELLPEQKKLYLAYLAKLQKDTLKHLAKEGLHKSRIKILAGLTRLRQLCCHPALFIQDYAGRSAKFEQLLEILEECRGSGKRVLVFSQFTEMLNLIRREMAGQGVPFFYLDGQTPSAERVELCSRFNEGERELFLISLKAGGTGLNLTGADTVILYDLWWNPAVEQQAADRAHRFGQKNVVQVIRLVTHGTVEEKMYALQQRKKDLIEEVIQPGQESLSTLTEQEIRELLLIE